MAALSAAGFGDGAEDGIEDGVLPALQDEGKGHTPANDAVDDSCKSGICTCAACGQDSRI